MDANQFHLAAALTYYKLFSMEVILDGDL